MSRLRATIAKTATDRQMQEHLNRAVREVEEAFRVVTAVQTEGYAQRRTVRDLTQALEVLRSVRHMGEPTTDPDAISEMQRNREHRRQLAEERREARRAKQVTEEVSHGG